MSLSLASSTASACSRLFSALTNEDPCVSRRPAETQKPLNGAFCHARWCRGDNNFGHVQGLLKREGVFLRGRVSHKRHVVGLRAPKRVGRRKSHQACQARNPGGNRDVLSRSRNMVACRCRSSFVVRSFVIIHIHPSIHVLSINETSLFSRLDIHPSSPSKARQDKKR